MEPKYYFPFMPFMLLYILFIAVACAVHNENRTTGQAEIESFIGTSLPSSVIDWQSEWQQGIDDLLMLKLTMPEIDLAPFLDELGFDKPLRDSYRPFSDTGRRNNWWDTTHLTKFVGGVVNHSDKTCEVIVDKSLENNVIVYLIVYER